jgi:hypothetical protein
MTIKNFLGGKIHNFAEARTQTGSVSLDATAKRSFFACVYHTPYTVFSPSLPKRNSTPS